MAEISLAGIGHRYALRNYALAPLDMIFEHGRTYALLGPSGCGKTTMLNIISGLLKPSDGRVLIDGRDVTGTETAARNIAQVFQFPVIYSAKSVAENLAFPLVCRGWASDRIRARVGEIAELLGLTATLGKRAYNLTADQKQLISLGRGLVRDDVAALLMDEPLTVIDPQSKFALRRKIKSIIEQARLTVIYVTHDQNEAMTFAHEVLVMKDGAVVQRGTPDELFERPRTAYVGYFIGSPAMNFLDIENMAGRLSVGGLALPATPSLTEAQRQAAGRKLQLGLRPEHIQLADAAETGQFPAEIVAVRDHGSNRVVLLRVGKSTASMKVGRDVDLPVGKVWLKVAPEKMRIYADGILLA
jgi:glycerol transport system ATP-binding protein